MVTLRPTAPADLSAVVAVEADPEASQWLGDTGIAWHRAALDDADQEHLLIIEGDQIVGFVVLAGLTNRHSSIELRRLVVARAARGRGVGRHAPRTAADRAFRSGAHRLWLDVKVGNDTRRRSTPARASSTKECSATPCTSRTAAGPPSPC